MIGMFQDGPGEEGGRGAKMQRTEESEYLSICLFYRAVTLVLSTSAYLISSLLYREYSSASWSIVLGMAVSCAMANFLYLKAKGNRFLTNVILVLELLAYGEFIYLSGGLASSYIWYYLGCILITLRGKNGTGSAIAALLWCLLCGLLSRSGTKPEHLKFNLVIGLILVSGGFFVLRSYVRMLWEERAELGRLNERLAEENRRSEYALHQLSNMYKGFGLMARVEPEGIIRQLAELMTNSISPQGCVIFERWADGSVKQVIASGLTDEQEQEIIKKSRLLWPDRKNPVGDLPREGCFGILAGGVAYEVLLLTELQSSRVYLLLSRDVNHIGEGRERDFYIQLSESIFRALDTQSQIESFISAEEKNRIADEIHDTVLQKIFGMACQLKSLSMRLGSLGEEELRSELLSLQNSAGSTMTELREAIYGRQFERGGEHSFEKSLASYMEGIEKNHSGVWVRLENEISEEELGSAQKIVLYRVACEAANNAVRHGGAHELLLRLEKSEESINMLVEDDGSGFQEETSRRPFEGQGMKNMYYLASLLKGRLSISDREGHGVRVLLKLPLGARRI